jgi:hypothetical protein
MSEKIEVRWEVADGYAGKSRPQVTRIQYSEIADCESEEDVRELIEQSIQHDFECKISPEYSESAYDDALHFWRGTKATGE